MIPSVIIGFLLAFPCIYLIYDMLFSEDLGFVPSIMPGWVAIVEALAIGILIPVFSSIIPIRRALSKNLTDSLNTQRSKQSGVLITFIDNTSKNLVPYVLFGSVSVAFGISVYYFLPLGLLSMNLGMILAIFFAILLGMMAGLTLLATNLQGILEVVLVYLFFFWERASMRALLRKNLGAHKQRNYLTSIIYALTLGCIIFLLVTASLEIQTISAANEIQNADIFVNSDATAILPRSVEPVLYKHEKDIKDFGYLTDRIEHYQRSGSVVRFSDRASLAVHDETVCGISPTPIMEGSFMFEYTKSNITLPKIEQLYTARGYQSMGTGTNNADLMISDIDDYR